MRRTILGFGLKDANGHSGEGGMLVAIGVSSVQLFRALSRICLLLRLACRVTPLLLHVLLAGRVPN